MGRRGQKKALCEIKNPHFINGLNNLPENPKLTNVSGSSIPAVRALRVRKDRVRFPAPRPIISKNSIKLGFY